jgi:hypothetical protein
MVPSNREGRREEAPEPLERGRPMWFDGLSIKDMQRQLDSDFSTIVMATQDLGLRHTADGQPDRPITTLLRHCSSK